MLDSSTHRDLPGETEVLLLSDNGGITTLTLNRPSKFNALSVQLLGALEDQFARIGEDRSIRAVILAGAGKAFCTGHDLKEMRDSPGKQAVQALFQQCSRVMLAMTRIPQPVIARVHGHRGRVSARRHMRPGGRRRGCPIRGIRRQSRPLLLDTDGGARPQSTPQAIDGDAVDRLTDRCIDGAALRAHQPRRIARPAGGGDGRARRSGGVKSPAAIAFGKQLFYRQLECLWRRLTNSLVRR